MLKVPFKNVTDSEGAQKREQEERRARRKKKIKKQAGTVFEIYQNHQVKVAGGRLWVNN